jgi:type VI secretion system secreted protein Hcp
MATSFLLDIAAIPGESQDDNSAYNNKIEIDGWNFGSSQTGMSQTGTGRVGGKVSVSDFHFTKHADKSSPKLMEYCATGQHIDKVLMTARRTGEDAGDLTPYLKITLTDVIVSSYSTNGSNGDVGLPAESISFNFSQVDKEYVPQDKGKTQGTLKSGYNLKTSAAT